ncbi:hypothetical protein Tco_0533025 [Tanacetum coccineum]
MSANDKFGLGYGDHIYDGILSYENEMLQSVFMNKESEIENQPLYDRFVTAEGMHVVPPPMTRNYMPLGPDVEIDDSQFTYELSELVSEPVVNESNVEFQPKVWSDAPIIEEYESDSEDKCVSIPTKQQETSSFANQQVKTPRENVKSHFTHSQKPKVDKKDLGYGFAVIACFVCGSLNYLIRDCDFHEKRMARKAELNNSWNNVQRVNKQNQFVPLAVLTRTGIIPVNTARASSDYPQRLLKNKGIVDSGCSRHMTGNKAYLAEFQDFNGGPVTFGGSKGYITGKGSTKANQKVQLQDKTLVMQGFLKKEDESPQDCFVLPIWPFYSSTITHELKTTEKRDVPREEEQVFMDELERLKRQEKEANEEAEALNKNSELVLGFFSVAPKFFPHLSLSRGNFSCKGKDEGASSERPSEAQPTPSPAPTSEVPHELQPDSSPAHTSEELEDHIKGNRRSLEEGSATQVTQTPTSFYNLLENDENNSLSIFSNMSQAKVVSREKEKAVEVERILKNCTDLRPTSKDHF